MADVVKKHTARFPKLGKPRRMQAKAVGSSESHLLDCVVSREEYLERSIEPFSSTLPRQAEIASDFDARIDRRYGRSAIFKTR